MKLPALSVTASTSMSAASIATTASRTVHDGDPAGRSVVIMDSTDVASHSSRLTDDSCESWAMPR